MKNQSNQSKIPKATERVDIKFLPNTKVGISDTPKNTMTRLDMKVMRQRAGLGYEQLANQVVGKMEKDLKGAMKAQNKKYSDVPGKLGRKHPY